jgi:ubiquinone/menaquinone biosynthesis C-methylase UbiE
VSDNSNVSPNRYANDWNAYSAMWDDHYGSRYRNLGDEWCDDGTAQRAREQRLFAQVAEPRLSPQTRVLEIGPGGGKWTVRLAPIAGHVTVFDVADAMLERTRRRCDQEGLTNVSFQLGNGADLTPLPDASQHVVFSYDVFVHIALEDTVTYLQEIARVLTDGGVAIIHHAVADTRDAWDRIESHNDWYRHRANTMGQYYYYSHDALERLYGRAGLRVKAMYTEYCTVVITAEKPVDTVAPKLEQGLRKLAMAGDDSAATASAIQELAAVSRELQDRLQTLLAIAEQTRPGQARYDAIQRIRRLIRG